MSKLLRLKSRMLDFYDLDSEKAEKALLAEILAYSKTVKPADFTTEVQQYFEPHPDSGVGVIYEALSAQPAKWGDFYVAEYRRAFEEAETSLEPFEVLESLEEICMAEDTGFGEELIRVAEPYLNHQTAAIRLKAIWMIFDWLTIEDKRKYPQVIRKVKERLQDDN